MQGLAAWDKKVSMRSDLNVENYKDENKYKLQEIN
jgi:hypothetical protein